MNEPKARWPWGRRKSLFVPVFIWAGLAPCGLVHLYAGRYVHAAAIFVVYVGSAVLLSMDHAWAMVPMMAAYTFDLIAGSEAVLAYNRRT